MAEFPTRPETVFYSEYSEVYVIVEISATLEQYRMPEFECGAIGPFESKEEAEKWQEGSQVAGEIIAMRKPLSKTVYRKYNPDLEQP